MSDTARRFGWTDANGNFDIEKVREWEDRLKRRREELKDRVEVLAQNMLSCQVCALRDLTAEQVQELANEVNPAGTTHGWHINDEVPPVECSQNVDRLHWILVS